MDVILWFVVRVLHLGCCLETAIANNVQRRLLFLEAVANFDTPLCTAHATDAICGLT